MSQPLPDGWKKFISSRSGREYYVNRFTGEEQESVPTSDQPVPAEPKKVRALHLLVKHTGSRRPVRHDGTPVTRSRDEALEKLRGYMNTIEGADNKEAAFRALASEYSDCSSAKRDGDLGPFQRGAMQKPFEEAAFALPIGKMSDVVSTDSGLHAIFRIPIF